MPQQRKILAIPYVLFRKSGRKPRFLTVRDAEYDEWTFISGTCESRETVDHCAIREIWEETKGLVALRKIPKRTRRFRTNYEGNRVDVMFIPLQITEEEIVEITEQFPYVETGGRVEMEENTDLRFETMGRFMRKKKLWNFIKRLVETEEFHNCCPT